MKLKRFRASHVHGYMEFDVRFNSDLTFITGINGSGKTTVLQAIVQLITPSIELLALKDFSSMYLDVSSEGKDCRITAVKRDGVLKLGYSAIEEELSIKLPEWQDLNESNDPRLDEDHREFLENQISLQLDHPFIHEIRSLPTPMFLGLERRIDYDIRGRRRPLRPSRSRNVFGQTMAEGSRAAASLVSHKHNQMRVEKEDLADELRKKLVVRAFDIQGGGFVRSTGKVPSKYERNKILNSYRDVEKILPELGVDQTEISRNVEPFFADLKEMFRNLPQQGKVFDLIDDPKLNEDQRDAVLGWMTSGKSVGQYQDLLSLFEKYSESVGKIESDLNEYVELVNRFLGESSKTVEIDRLGHILVRHSSGMTSQLDQLSSGETQIVIILTYLALHPSAIMENVLVVDEPELSLHVAWQELFAESVQTLNPHLQLVFATHSPAIILDQVSKCVPLQGGAR